MENIKINFIDILKVYLRSFLYQNLINLRNMQDFGFNFVIYPVLKKFKKDKKKIISAILKNYEYFNTNPVFASFLFGVILNFIERNEFEKVQRYKFEIMAPLAALGDAFVFGTFLPFLLFLSISFIILKQWSGILIFLIGYNLVINLFFRFYGIIIGYKYGINFIFKLAKLNLQNIIAILKKISLFLWGVMFYILIIFNYKILKSPFEIFSFNITKLLFVGIIILSIIFYDFLNRKFVPILIYMIYVLVITFLYFLR